MNKYLIILILLALLSCKKAKNARLLTKVEIQKQELNFETISLGDTLFKTIKIKNIGRNALVIDTVGVSCGCTLVSYDKIPLNLDEYATIKVKFIPTEKGSVKKSIVVESNTDPPFNTFYIIGEVK